MVVIKTVTCWVRVSTSWDSCKNPRLLIRQQTWLEITWVTWQEAMLNRLQMFRSNYSQQQHRVMVARVRCKVCTHLLPWMVEFNSISTWHPKSDPVRPLLIILCNQMSATRSKHSVPKLIFKSLTIIMGEAHQHLHPSWLTRLWLDWPRWN